MHTQGQCSAVFIAHVTIKRSPNVVSGVNANIACLLLLLFSRLPRLPELLTSSNVDLRITAGETIALFYEILRSEDAAVS